ncbi:uncharacterized protein LOC128877186 [Hylaeus volcanicus]|uniref:uncharacterized protein LOC128877186 n=1 Tax=Hylaeus volcanicus TaxID=313075 RepID=UPI0023B8136E|nr:uncharacterized protein LOC128877186 [Hylaeus volcanicus]
MESKYQNNILNKNSNEISPLKLLHNIKDYSEKESVTCSSKPCVSTTSDCISPSKNRNNFTSINQVTKLFTKLQIQSNIKYNEEKDEHLAGNIINIIQTLNIVLVKPISPDYLLYFGTPLFLNCTNPEICGTKYKLLGYIDDIFGSIGDPMYSITMMCNPKDIMNINTRVYYFPNNPSTEEETYIVCRTYKGRDFQ